MGSRRRSRSRRGGSGPRLTPLAIDYDTVGAFYATLDHKLRAFVAHHGEKVAFCGDPALQLSPAEVGRAIESPLQCRNVVYGAARCIGGLPGS